MLLFIDPIPPDKQVGDVSDELHRLFNICELFIYVFES